MAKLTYCIKSPDYQGLDKELSNDFGILSRLNFHDLPSPRAVKFEFEHLQPANSPVETTLDRETELEVEKGEFSGGTYPFQQPGLRNESSASPTTSLVLTNVTNSCLGFSQRFHKIEQALVYQSAVRDPTQLRVVYQSLQVRKQQFALLWYFPYSLFFLQTWKLLLDFPEMLKQLLHADKSFPWKSSTRCGF